MLIVSEKAQLNKSLTARFSFPSALHGRFTALNPLAANKAAFMNIRKSRYSIALAFFILFTGLSFITRIIFTCLSAGKADMNVLDLLEVFGLGFLYDAVVAACFLSFYGIYLLVLPERLNRSRFNRIFTLSFLGIAMLIILFSFLAEFTFWQEFESRFNFIAVDYLLYTYEVMHNIRESYPLPLLIAGMVAILLLVFLLFHKSDVLYNSFAQETPFTQRLLFTAIICLVAFGGLFGLQNSFAEQGTNRYRNELGKAGIFSFFAAFKNNELSYDHFYALLNADTAFSIIRNELEEPNTRFLANSRSVSRQVTHTGTVQKPNVIMVTIESLSADFLGSFGNADHLTPVLDLLAAKGICFRNMYATGTRTVRGMEALSLAVPPTPGSSIVRRPDNDDLNTIGNIFAGAGYARTFLYGGDGYFDNMNEYFGGNGFSIMDRGHNIPVADNRVAERTRIADNKVHFENAWGICDEDLLDAVISRADSQYARKQLFYDFVMTTSNHRPYSFPAGTISLPAGQRNAAVRYTDFAIGAFLQKAATKPWYNNTIFIFVADHCASSAGKNEIDISKYHIPCIIYQPAMLKALSIEQKCSQVDLYPTLFSLLHWTYNSSLYGTDVMQEGYKSRILLGTYQKLAYLSGDSLVILSPQQKLETYRYNWNNNTQTPASLGSAIKDRAIAQYQTAYYLFKNGGFKQ